PLSAPSRVASGSAACRFGSTSAAATVDSPALSAVSISERIVRASAALAGVATRSSAVVTGDGGILLPPDEWVADPADTAECSSEPFAGGKFPTSSAACSSVLSGG